MVTICIGISAPPVPPRHFEQQPTVGTKLEGLLLNEIDSDQDFDPRGFENNSTSHTFPNMNGSASSPPLCKFKYIHMYTLSYLFNIT